MEELQAEPLVGLWAELVKEWQIDVAGSHIEEDVAQKQSESL